MAALPTPVRSFSAGRRWSIRLQVLVSILAMLALTGMANYLAVRHVARFYLTSDPTYRLSPLTVRLLNSLTNDVKAVVFFDKKESLYRPVEALLKEYVLQTPRLSVEFVDYPRDLAAATLVKERYKRTFAGAEKNFEGARNLVLFESAGNTASIFQNQLSEYDYSGILTSNEVRRTAFKGEQLFNAAILQVTDARPRKAYFLQGHDEHDPDSDDERQGYSKFAGLLRLNNTQPARLYLRGTNDIPADCDLLILAAPQANPLDRELEQIDAFLGRGGRVLVLLRSVKAVRLDPLLNRWNVQVGQNIVLDPQNTVNNQDLITTNFTSHPIVKNLLRSQMHLMLPRSIERLPGLRSTADAARVDELIRTSPSGQARVEFRNGMPVTTPNDRHGQIPLAVAVEKGTLPGVAATRGATRMVVVGESQFLGNTLIDSLSNYDFAVLAVNWLLDRPQLQGGVGPRPVREYKLVMTDAQQRSVHWILLLGLPGGILLLGLVVWWRRRS